MTSMKFLLKVSHSLIYYERLIFHNYTLKYYWSTFFTFPYLAALYLQLDSIKSVMWIDLASYHKTKKRKIMPPLDNDNNVFLKNVDWDTQPCNIQTSKISNMCVKFRMIVWRFSRVSSTMLLTVVVCSHVKFQTSFCS